jgi:hypothetical protein
MDKFEQLQSLVGTDGIKKILQDAAVQAVNAGDWQKVRAIADFAIKRANIPREDYRYQQKDPLDKLEDIDLTEQIPDFIQDI